MLLACTLVGLAAMHSLGHDPILGTAGHHSHTATTATGIDCGGARCVQQVAPPPEEPRDGHHPGWAVCMAIAAALALAVVLAAHFLRGRRGNLPSGRATKRVTSSRGPPGFRTIGLITTSVSVLRT